jgi:tetratricopeptide (TPR) repeat protein
MAGQGEGASWKEPETTAVSGGDSSVERPKFTAGDEGITLPGVAPGHVGFPRTAPHQGDVTSSSPIAVGSGDAKRVVEASGSRPPSESSSVFRSIGATVFREGDILGGRYEITKLLGMGGMGAVYKAHDIEVERTVGLKVIRPDLAENPAILARFKQELVLARQITHKNIIRIYDLSDADGVKFITMEFIEGEDLKTILTRQGKLPTEEAVEFLHQTCAGLSAAHAEGVIHRDLKPANIIRDPSGRVVIMDFGLARTLQGEGMTQTGMMVGTMEYMSPEQATGLELDATSDIYAVGLIAYEMLTGKMPYAAESAVASLLKRSQQRAKPMIEVDSSIPRDLSTIVSRCIEPDRKKRYQSTAELIGDLGAFQPSAASKASGSVAVRRPPLKAARTIPAWAKWGAVSVVALLVAAIGLYEWKWRPKPQVAHATVRVLVGDFTNHTGDPIFEGTLEPMFNVALEGASFVSAYNRTGARSLAGKLPHPSDKLDEQSARLVAISQGVSAVVTGELSLRGSKYVLSATALDAVTGNVLAQTEASAPNKDELLLAIPKLAAPIRTALGDRTPESVQVEKAGGAFTAASLEVAHQYALAMDALFAGNMDGAQTAFSKAVELDPAFARAYAGLAAVYGNTGKTDEAEKYVKLAVEHTDRLTDRERYRVRGFYYKTTGDWQKCVDEYGELVKLYPADNVGQANLAGCYMHLRNAPKAIDAAKSAVEMVPQGALQRVALSFYDTYGGDFAGGEKEARKALEIHPSLSAYLALVESQIGQGQVSQATETYNAMQKLGPAAASITAFGLADLANYQGRFAEAIRMLEQGAAADLAAKDQNSAAAKYATISRTQMMRHQNAQAVSAASKALTLSHEEPVRFLAALTFAEAGDPTKARELAVGLAAERQVEAQTWAKILEGKLALQRGDKNEAIKTLNDANNLLDTWIGRFELGRAYFEAGLFVEADSEFDRCIKRRGEAVELFMDNTPTISYFPPVYYYQGLVQQQLKNPGFADSYRAYLKLRGDSAEDPLVPTIRRNIGQ